MSLCAQAKQEQHLQSLPRLGFIGTGWIGRLRMEALLQPACCEFTTVYDPSPEAVKAAAALVPEAQIATSLEQVIEQDLDGVVIATPSAFHAEQSILAMNHGKAVFCQKPLARTAAETQRVVDVAKSRNTLLAVDFSYRYLNGMNRLREIIASGELGTVFASDLTFHNAYGPDKPWFYDVSASGGGCVMDLGIHLVDLVIWLLGDGEVDTLNSRLMRQGEIMQPPYTNVEDYARASFMHNGTDVQLCCSWNLHAGQDAFIETIFYGTRGGIAMRNVNGSFYDFEIYRFNGTTREKIAGFPDDWGGRALCQWAKQLTLNADYDPAIEQLISVAEVIDGIYQR